MKTSVVVAAVSLSLLALSAFQLVASDASFGSRSLLAKSEKPASEVSVPTVVDELSGVAQEGSDYSPYSLDEGSVEVLEEKLKPKEPKEGKDSKFGEGIGALLGASKKAKKIRDAVDAARAAEDAAKENFRIAEENCRAISKELKKASQAIEDFNVDPDDVADAVAEINARKRQDDQGEDEDGSFESISIISEVSVDNLGEDPASDAEASALADELSADVSDNEEGRKKWKDALNRFALLTTAEEVECGENYGKWRSAQNAIKKAAKKLSKALKKVEKNVQKAKDKLVDDYSVDSGELDEVVEDIVAP